MSLAILVPVLNRPHRVKPLLDSIEASTPGHPAVLFLTDGCGADYEEIERQEDDHPGVFVLVNPDGGSYAQKINRGVELTSSSHVFLAADDLDFKPGWFHAAVVAMDSGAEVVGVNDLLRRRPRRRLHATHFLMTREYAQQPCLDGGRGPCSEAYAHNFVDDELIATATARGVYTYAPDSHVEHRHWMNQAAEMDATYEKGCSTFEADRRIFEKREALWASTPLSA